MRIETATPGDARAIAEIHVEAWQTAYASIIPMEYLSSLSIDEREAMWANCIDAGSPNLFVAKEDERLYGWICIGKCRDEGSSNTEAEIWAIYVSSSAWSKGIGQALWQHARAHLLEQGYKSCSLWVLLKNERAINFYTSAGFSRVNEAPKEFELYDEKIQEVRFATKFDG